VTRNGDYLRKKDREEIGTSKVIQPRVIQLQTTAWVRFAAGDCWLAALSN
jgi:hypothetical protein